MVSTYVDSKKKKKKASNKTEFKKNPLYTLSRMHRTFSNSKNPWRTLFVIAWLCYSKRTTTRMDLSRTVPFRLKWCLMRWGSLKGMVPVQLPSEWNSATKLRQNWKHEDSAGVCVALMMRGDEKLKHSQSPHFLQDSSWSPTNTTQLPQILHMHS